MRVVLALVRKDFLLFFRDRADFAVTFFVPVVLIYIFGQVFHVQRQTPGDGFGSATPARIRLAITRQSAEPLVTKVIDALSREPTFQLVATEKDAAGHDQPITEDRARALIRKNELRFALIFPPDAVRENALGLKVKFLTNPINAIESETVTGLLQKTIYSVAPIVLLQSLPDRLVRAVGGEAADQFAHELANNLATTFGGDPANLYHQLRTGSLDLPRSFPGALGTAPAPPKGSGEQSNQDFLSQLVQLQTEQVTGTQVKNPMATRLVGGWAMMFLMFSVSGSAAALFNEKKAGLFLRLLSMPVRRTHILWSKYLYGMALGLIQLTVMFGAGHFLYGIDVWSHFGNLLAACLAASTACTAFGMLLASIAPSPQAASGLATLIILTMSAIGGAWFPTSFMSEFIQHLSKLTIVYWSIEGFQQVLWAGSTFRELLPTLGILLGISAVVNLFSVWRFTRGTIFE